MPAGFASVIVTVCYRFAADHASWEIAATRTTYRIILRDKIFTLSSWALYSLSRSLLGWMFGEDAYSDVGVSLTIFKTTHTFQLDKCS